MGLPAIQIEELREIDGEIAKLKEQNAALCTQVQFLEAVARGEIATLKSKQDAA
jgi:hypothetical protein